MSEEEEAVVEVRRTHGMAPTILSLFFFFTIKVSVAIFDVVDYIRLQHWHWWARKDILFILQFYFIKYLIIIIILF